MYGTIHFEELPLHIEHHSIQALRPTSIEEDEDDPRSLLYLFDDNDFERAAAFLAIEEVRQRAQAAAHARAAAEALAEAQQQRTRALANRLRQLLEEDEELIDMLGRRILATNGYQVPDLWQHPPHHYRPHPSQYHRPNLTHAFGSEHASISRRSPTADAEARTDAHAILDEVTQQASPYDHLGASTFIHAAPLIVRGHAPFQSKPAQRIALASQSAKALPSSSSNAFHTPAHTRIAIHPLTGVPMLLIEQDSADALPEPSHQAPQFETAPESDGEADEWAIEDESDLDWLGHEILRRQSGANVWVLGTDDNDMPRLEARPSASQVPSVSASAPSTTHEPAGKQANSTEPTLPVEVEEVESDHEAVDAARALGTSISETLSGISSPSQRVAAALARAALQSPKPAHTSSKPRTARHRAATVMSESEEEELETVGKPVVDSDAEDATRPDDASSLSDRPRKSVKVVDLR